MMNSQPYPWPYDDPDAAVDPKRTIVVACGMQRHWIRMLPVGTDETATQILDMIDEARSFSVSVMWVRHGAVGDAVRSIDRTLPRVGSSDWELIALPYPNDVVVDTPGHDAFISGWTDAELRSRGIDRLLLMGLGTESTVSGTLRSANDRGYECLTLIDAVAHHSPDTGAATLSSITMSGGIFGAVGTFLDLFGVAP